MGKTFKKLLSLLVAIVMVVGMLPAAIFATETTGNTIEVATGAELTTAVNTTAVAGDTIKLTADIASYNNTSNQILSVNKDLTLDLNGKTLRWRIAASGYPITVQAGATLTIKDSSAEGTGTMVAMLTGATTTTDNGDGTTTDVVTLNQPGRHMINVSGNLIIEGGNFAHYNPDGVPTETLASHLVMVQTTGTATLKGGVLTALGTGKTIQKTGSGVVSVEGGVFNVIPSGNTAAGLTRVGPTTRNNNGGVAYYAIAETLGEGSVKVDSAWELKAALESGFDATLGASFAYDAPDWIDLPKADVTLDLAGKTIDMQDSGMDRILDTMADYTLTINDSVGGGGIINAKKIVRVNNGSKLTINGGTFLGTDSYTFKNGTKNLFKSVFYMTQNDYAAINVNGGTFSEDPTVTLGVNKTFQTNTDGTFTIVDANVVEVDTFAELQSNLQAGVSVKMTDDIAVTAQVVMKEVGATLDLNGYKLTNAADSGVDRIFNVYNNQNNTSVDLAARLNVIDSSAAGTGAIESASRIFRMNTGGVGNSAIHIYSGNYICNHSSSMFWSRISEITGGTFSEDPTAYLGSGLTALVADGKTYVVQDAANAPTVNEDGSVTVDSATDFYWAIANGKNVVLAQDLTIEASQTIDLPESITIELGEYTLTINTNHGQNVFGLVNGASVVINATTGGITVNAKVLAESGNKGFFRVNIQSGVATHLAINGGTYTWINASGTVCTCNNMFFNISRSTEEAVPVVTVANAQFVTDFGILYNNNGTAPASMTNTTYVDTAVSTEAVSTDEIVTWTWTGGAYSIAVHPAKTPSYNGTSTMEKEADAEFTYTFEGWAEPVQGEDGNYTVEPIYTTVTNTYTVIWTNEDGTVLETDENVPYGTWPSYDGLDPVKASENGIEYIFNGWTPSIDSVTGNVTYVAHFTYEGAEDRPIMLWEPQNTITNVGTTYYGGYFNGMNMVITGTGDFSVIYNGETLTAVDGEVTALVSSPNPRMPVTFAIVGDGEFTVEFIAPLGTMDNPDTLVLGSNTATVDEGSQGYYYTWTATEYGKLTITMPEGNWFYVVNNLTTGKYGDWQYSDNDPVVSSDSVVVKAGDKVQVQVNTYDPANMWTAPAGSLTFTASFEKLSVPTGTISIKSNSLELESIVYMNFKSQVTGFEGVDIENNMGLVMWTGDEADYREELLVPGNENVTVNPGATFDGSRWVTQTTGIDAKKLGDEWYMRVYLELPDGSYAYSQVTYNGAQKYIIGRLLNSSDVNLKKALVAMLDYSAAAQVNFGYKTEELANNLDAETILGLFPAYTETQVNKVISEAATYASAYNADMVIPTVSADASIVGDWNRDATAKANFGVTPNLVLEGIITNQYKITLKGAVANAEIAYARILFWDAETYEQLLADGVPFNEYNATMVQDFSEDNKDNQGRYVGAYDKTAAKDMGKTLYLCVLVDDWDGNTYTSGVIAHSAHAYLADRIKNSTDADMVALAKALVNYGDAAAYYFANR